MTRRHMVHFASAGLLAAAMPAQTRPAGKRKGSISRGASASSTPW